MGVRVRGSRFTVQFLFRLRDRMGLRGFWRREDDRVDQILHIIIKKVLSHKEGRMNDRFCNIHHLILNTSCAKIVGSNIRQKENRQRVERSQILRQENRGDSIQGG
jgi:hypothetical protein